MRADAFRELNIIHTDLKLENVMLTKPLKPRPVADVESVARHPAANHNVTWNGKLSRNQKKRIKAKLKKHALHSASSLSSVSQSLVPD